MNEQKARELVYRRSGGTCEMCGRNPGTNWHHRQLKGQGGPWCPSNGLHLCGSGTTGCHGLVTMNPALAKERGWSVSAYADPTTNAVWLAGLGWALLRDDGVVTPADRSAA